MVILGTNKQIEEALVATALDLGDVAGRDDEYGHGLVQGLAAYSYLLDQPAPCGTGDGTELDPVGDEEDRLVGWHPKGNDPAAVRFLVNPGASLSQILSQSSPCPGGRSARAWA